MTTAVNSAPSQSLLTTMNGTASTTSASSDTQNRFLTLLVEQMKNQDPLNPMDNAQVTSQMAQLSTVQGVETLNTTLTTMMTNAKNSESLQSANLIGHAALVAGSTIHLNSSTDTAGTTTSYGEFGVELPANTDNLKVTITDSSGNTVKEYSLGKQNAGILPLSWDGTDSSGNTVTKGDYKFAVSATTGGKAATVNPLSLETISSITTGSSGVQLNLSNATSVATSDLKQIF
ncbi:MAG TPA: flagellar hook assembly protein FlgD [Methylophilaceae bacterium]|jgi:flagellar basal-body rod modification protein FlgD